MPEESKNPTHSIEQVVDAVQNAMGSLLKRGATGDAGESEAETIDAERVGRTNAVRAAADGDSPEPGRWDSIGESREGLDDLQGHVATDASPRDPLAESGTVSPPFASGPPAQPRTAITPALWDQFVALRGETLETPKGEPFAVIDVTPGVSLTVSPLDGGGEWAVSAQELEAAWMMVRGGEPLDGLASIRLQEEGLGPAHPEYVAGLLRSILGADEA